jgi:hypothetical protein
MTGLIGLLVEVAALEAVVKSTKRLRRSNKVDSLI